MARQEVESPIVLKERSFEPNDKPKSGKKIIFKQRNETGGSDERLTPANEYDIVIDSASRPIIHKVQTNSIGGRKSVIPSTPPEVDPNVKTARQIGQVKTMSQVNERHDKYSGI